MAAKSKKSKPLYSDQKLDELIQEATVDCYDEDEQVMGLMTMLEENLDAPFETQLLGETVQVETIEIRRGREIVAICRRGGESQAIPLADLPLPSPPPEGAEWIAAYKRWASMF